MLGLGNESYNASNKPRTLVCFICGREYGTLSLPIHLKTCEQKFLMEEQKKPKHLRRPLPQKPKTLGEGMNQNDIDMYNQNAFETYNNDALETCWNCGRTFKPESLIIHQKMCKPDRPFKPLTGYIQDKKKIEFQQSNKAPTQERGYGQSVQQPVLKRPKTLMCYICGREYGTKSLGIHIKQCKEMFLVQENKKPKADRRKPPNTPPALIDLISNENITDSDIQAYNTGAYNKYNYEALVPCPNCARTFKPEAFVHHQNACFSDKPFKPLNQEIVGTSSLQPCSKCGRSFVPDRIQKHQSVCKGDSLKIDPSKTANITQTQWVKPDQITQKPSKHENVTNNNLSKSTVHSDVEKVDSQNNYRKQFKPSLEENQLSKVQPKQNSYTQLQPTQEVIQENENEFYQQEDKVELQPQEFEQQESLVQCGNCQRKFTEDRIAKHQKVCKGTKIQEVKVEKLIPVVQTPKKDGEVPKWKQQHEAFTQVIQYNKKLKDIEEKGGDIKLLGPPPRSNDDHLSKCPYCSRKFDPARIDTHINICQNVVNKPRAVPQQLNTPGRDFKISQAQKSDNKNLNKSQILNQSSEMRRSTSRNLTSSQKPTKSPYKPQQTNIFQNPTTNLQKTQKHPFLPQMPNNSQEFQQFQGREQKNGLAQNNLSKKLKPKK